MGDVHVGRGRLVVAPTVLPVKRRKAAAAYIAAWSGAAAAAVLLLARLSAPPSYGNLAEIVLFMAVSAAADTLVLRLHHGESTEFISLLEAAICINIVLFPAPVALAVTLAGSTASHIVHRQHPIKVLFNIAQYAAGSVCAIGVYHLIAAGGPAFGWRNVVALAAAMISFGLVNTVALSGLVSLLEGTPFRRTVEDGFYLSMLTVLGNTALGILAAAIWVSHPTLTVLFVAPAATLHLAYRGVVRTSELLETVASERDRLNRVIGGASDGIALINAEGNIDVWSPSMARLTGVSAGTAAGKPLASVITGCDADGRPLDLLAPMREATAASPTASVEMILSHSEGATRVVKVNHSVLFDAEGRCTGDAMIVHDVTREHESQRLKDDFLARVSHELRTPLTPIKGYAQTLLRKGDKVPAAARDRALSSIVNRVDHMHALVEDLLLVSRITSGRASLDDQIRPGYVDVREVCDQVLRSFKVAEPNRKLGLSVPEDLPGTIADPARVEQIVANLVSNACKYSDADSQITVVLRNEGDHVAIDVVDQGRGISPHDIDRIFDRFFRAEDPLTMTTGGVGLGLHISHELAHAMGGTLTVRSSVGRGSTFTLRLPLVPTGGTAPARKRVLPTSPPRASSDTVPTPVGGLSES